MLLSLAGRLAYRMGHPISRAAGGVGTSGLSWSFRRHMAADSKPPPITVRLGPLESCLT
jgi:hypothetical protein